MKKLILTMALALALPVTGCVTTKGTRAKTAAIEVVEATPSEVEGCDFLGTVHGTSVMVMGTPRAKASHAREKVFREAEALGATHVVMSELDWGYFKGGESTGRAYRCADEGREEG